LKYLIAFNDSLVEKVLSSRFSIRGYPSIKFLKNGTVYDYQGNRSLESFVEFATGGYQNATSLPISSLSDIM